VAAFAGEWEAPGLKVLVTGAAGFIGSHTVEALLDRGHEVVAVDAITDYYDRMQKWSNVEGFRDRASFVRADLLSADLPSLFDGVDSVVHLAGQPGVRSSWASEFAVYVDANISVTQRLLEFAKTRRIQRFVYASSSSVYGNSTTYPTSELALPQPVSPYGVTKLAAEHLCSVYAANFGVPTVSLRYFTVFGPRQRPDMAMHRLIAATLGGPRFPLFGDGRQIRDFTYVGDIVEANVLALERDVVPGTVMNVSGGDSADLTTVIRTIEDLLGVSIPIERRAGEPGDVDRTGASTERIESVLGWRPRTKLREGLARQVEWHHSRPSVQVSRVMAPVPGLTAS
jgi:nucleoside-diphosphate-sugar epimerase